MRSTWKSEAAKKYPHITFEDDDDNDAEFVLNEDEDDEFDEDHEIDDDSDFESLSDDG